MHNLETNKQTWFEWIYVSVSEIVAQLVSFLSLLALTLLPLVQNVSCVFIGFLDRPYWGERSTQDNDRYKIKATWGIFLTQGP